tara:strand:- start:687 stop:1097 length:411 start_codon:yes stop_codon:yes gene_type:complete
MNPETSGVADLSGKCRIDRMTVEWCCEHSRRFDGSDEIGRLDQTIANDRNRLRLFIGDPQPEGVGGGEVSLVGVEQRGYADRSRCGLHNFFPLPHVAFNGNPVSGPDDQSHHFTVVGSRCLNVGLHADSPFVKASR